MAPGPVGNHRPSRWLPGTQTAQVRRSPARDGRQSRRRRALPIAEPLGIGAPADDRFDIRDQARQMAAVARGNPIGSFREPPGRPIASAHARNAADKWQARGQLGDRRPGAVNAAVNVQDVDGSHALVRGQRGEQAGDPAVGQGQYVQVIESGKGPDQGRDSASEPSMVVVEKDGVATERTHVGHAAILPAADRRRSAASPCHTRPLLAMRRIDTHERLQRALKYRDTGASVKVTFS